MHAIEETARGQSSSAPSGDPETAAPGKGTRKARSLFPIDVQGYRTTTKDALVSLRQAIINGDLRPGDRLVEPLIAQQLHVSRTPVREAIFQLESEGLVRRVPYRGAVVAKISSRDVEEIYAVKSVLEGLAARLACERVTADQVEHLRALLTQMEGHQQEKDLDSYTQASRNFHLRIVELAGNLWLLETYKKLEPPIQGLRILALSLPGRPKNSLREHRAILEAIAKGDPERARLLTERHVQGAGARLKASFLEKGR